MTEQCKMELSAAGIQVEDALGRFMDNEGLLARFLKKFPDDENYALLLRALDSENTEAAFRASHTLKGICGNLSMGTLFALVSEQTEYLRAGDLSAGARLMPQITQEYEMICGTIQRCLAI